jgi:hypothetical protein
MQYIFILPLEITKVPFGSPVFKNHSIPKTKYFGVWTTNIGVLENPSHLRKRLYQSFQKGKKNYSFGEHFSLKTTIFIGSKCLKVF